jgi:hypothetical protein
MCEQIIPKVYWSWVLVLLGEYGFLYGVDTLWILLFRRIFLMPVVFRLACGVVWTTQNNITIWTHIGYKYST